jgi:hypothetical protein
MRREESERVREKGGTEGVRDKQRKRVGERQAYMRERQRREREREMEVWNCGRVERVMSRCK